MLPVNRGRRGRPGHARLKQWRGIAIRYDKHALTYLGGVNLAASILRQRKLLDRLDAYLIVSASPYDYTVAVSVWIRTRSPAGSRIGPAAGSVGVAGPDFHDVVISPEAHSRPSPVPVRAARHRRSGWPRCRVQHNEKFYLVSTKQ